MFFVNRLAEEGYTPSENPVPTPVEQIVSPVFETKTLKELSDITDEEYIKVIQLTVFKTKFKFKLLLSLLCKFLFSFFRNLCSVR